MSAKITAVSNGPLRVEGDFELVDETGAAFGLTSHERGSRCAAAASPRISRCATASISARASRTRSARANAAS